MIQTLKVVEFEGLAPSVFCGLYFADQGCDVTIVTRKDPMPFSMEIHKNIMNRNKKCVCLSLKDPVHLQAIKLLLETADVVIDPYRPGVLQKLGLDPAQLHIINKKAILLRVTGYGQTGPSKDKAGHDLTYIAASGVLPLLNENSDYQFPTNFFADFVSASLGITGVLVALDRREKTGLGCIVDCSLTDGCTYFSQFMMEARKSDTNQKKAKPVFMNIKNDLYCYTANTVLTNSQILQLLSGKNYYSSPCRQIQISKVLIVPNFDPQALVNPFNPNINMSYTLRTRDSDTSSLLNKLNMSSSDRIIKPKL